MAGFFDARELESSECASVEAGVGVVVVSAIVTFGGALAGIAMGGLISPAMAADEDYKMVDGCLEWISTLCHCCHWGWFKYLYILV